MPDAGYTWDASARTYRDARARPVPWNAVRDAVDAVAGGAADEAEALSLRLADGAIEPEDWHLEMRRVIKRAHVAAVAAAVGGTARMTPEYAGLAGNRLAFRYGRLKLFERELLAGLPRDGAFVNRARMYARGAMASHQAARRKVAAGGFAQERRVLGATHAHCTPCLAHAGRGWQPTGTLPDVGQDCDCLDNCRCSFEHRKPARAARAPRPAPAPPPAAPAPAPPSNAPVLPGRPIAERLAAWAEGDALVAKVAAVAGEVRDEGRRLYREWQAVHDRLTKDLWFRKRGPERTRLMAEAEAQADALERTRLGLWTRRSEFVARAIGLPAGSGLPIAATPGGADGPDTTLPSPALMANVERARGWLTRVVAAAGAPGVAVEVRQISPAAEAAGRGRASYRDVDRLVRLAAADSDRTAVHEIAHAIEYRVPGVRDRADEFLAYRTRGEAARRLNDVIPGHRYRDDETGREDQFGRAFGESGWYVGRDYGGPTEVLSMGLEKLFEAGDEFAAQDPEYVKFLLGILTGALR